MVHGEQSLTLHAPLPVAGTVIGKTRVTEVVDRGAGKGAVIYLERSITDKANGTLLATCTMSAFCRADGGFGGPVTQMPTALSAMTPARESDHVVDYLTLPQLALIYWLSGDMNPLHADPAFAARAGFPRPILHGLATFGIVARAVISAVLQHEHHRFAGLRGRFSAPLYPGETVRVELWKDAAGSIVRASALERGVMVFSNGLASVRD